MLCNNSCKINRVKEISHNAIFSSCTFETFYVIIFWDYTDNSTKIFRMQIEVLRNMINSKQINSYRQMFKNGNKSFIFSVCIFSFILCDEQ